MMVQSTSETRHPVIVTLATSRLLVLILLFSLALTGCTKGRPDAAARERAEAEAEAAAGELGKSLFAALSSALESGTQAEAVHVCSNVAQEIADALSKERRITLGRTALRVRNSKNAPDDWETRVLEGWQASPEERGVVSELIEEGDAWVLRQMRPIMTGELCTGCHGAPDSFSEDLRTAIADRYPDDRATGFAAGDLRGAFTVTVPID